MLVYQRVFVDLRNDQPSGSLVMTHKWSSKRPLKTTRLGPTAGCLIPKKSIPIWIKIYQNPEKIDGSTAW